MLSLLLLLGAQAATPPPDYRAALLGAVEAECDTLIAQGMLDEALDLARRAQANIEVDARLTYEEGLIQRLRGDNAEAQRLYEAALVLDPSLGMAWYDLGELQLLRGDLAAAEQAFLRATELTAEHPQGWAGPFRLAELAGQQGNAADFDRWLKEAVRRGFRFATVAGDPRWTGFLRDPTLGEVLRRLIVVYGEEPLLDSWQ